MIGWRHIGPPLLQINCIWRQKLGRPRRRNIPIAISIAPEFPPEIANFDDFGRNYRPPVVGNSVKWPGDQITAIHFYINQIRRRENGAIEILKLKKPIDTPNRNGAEIAKISDRWAISARLISMIPKIDPMATHIPRITRRRNMNSRKQYATIFRPSWSDF